MRLWKAEVIKKSVFAALILGFFLPLTSCVRLEESAEGQAVWLPWADDQGNYKFQKISVSTVESWSPLKGKSLDIRGNAQSTKDGTFLTSQEIFLEITHDHEGTVIPLTPFSIGVAAVYAHFERLQKQDAELHLPPIVGKQKVFVGYKAGKQINGTDNVFNPRINSAYYDGRADTFFIMPYQMDGIPLSVNGGILAHEYFHSIFGRLVLQPLLNAANESGVRLFDFNGFTPHNPAGEKLSSMALSNELAQILFVNKTLFVGLNEGLADAWGWVYGQDPCFMVKSYGAEQGQERCLTVQPETSFLLTPEALSFRYFLSERSGENSVNVGYEVGTNLAQLIYLRFQERGEVKNKEAQRLWQQRLVELLPSLKTVFLEYLIKQRGVKSYLPWEHMVDEILFGQGSPAVPESECPRWRRILRSAKYDEMIYFQKHCALSENPSAVVEGKGH